MNLLLLVLEELPDESERWLIDTARVPCDSGSPGGGVGWEGAYGWEELLPCLWWRGWVVSGKSLRLFQ